MYGEGGECLLPTSMAMGFSMRPSPPSSSFAKGTGLGVVRYVSTALEGTGNEGMGGCENEVGKDGGKRRNGGGKGGRGVHLHEAFHEVLGVGQIHRNH